MRNLTSRSIFAAAFAMLLVLVLLRTLAWTRGDSPGQKDEEKAEAMTPPSPVVIENGKTEVKLNPETQERLGIKAVPLEAARERKEATAPGVMLDVQELVTLTTSYASAQANLRKAENNLSVSQSEYDRLKTLYAKQQNVSQKAFQTGEGLFHNDQTDVRMARQNIAFVMAALRQSWGNKIAEWVANDSPTLDRILNREDMLVQVTLPADGPAIAPREVSLELPNQRRLTASLVSRFPRVDPRVQGASFLYRTSAAAGLGPGLNLTAHLAVGRAESGVLVPASAVVWWQGVAWVYVETAPGEFTREAIQAGHPVDSGFFVTTGFVPGEKVVAHSEEQLLAIELNPTPQPLVGGEGEGDDD